MKQKGQMKKLINTVLDGFLKLSNEAFEVYNFHVFGYLVHIVPDSDGRTHSKMWGSTPAYTKMLLDYKVATNQEVHTWESRIKLSQLSLTDQEKFPEYIIPPEDYTGRDDARSVFNTQMRHDMGRVLFYRDELGVRDALKGKISWKQWPKQAVLKSLRIINWPSYAALPTVKGSDAPRTIQHEDMKTDFEARNAIHPNIPWEGDRETISYTSVVSWSPEEQVLSPLEDAWNDIPIIVDDQGKALMTAKVGKGFLRGTRPRTKVEKRVKAIRDDADDNVNHETDVSESDDDTLPAHHVKSKGKGKRKQAQSDNETDLDHRRGKKSRATSSLGRSVRDPGPSRVVNCRGDPGVSERSPAPAPAETHTLVKGTGYPFPRMRV
ncbi:hypothetical protein H0H92_008967 [Tricholoma furcatifolium]|nr:hypothetical protein H0H92_008967 [Tricholoma furcatifolium]